MHSFKTFLLCAAIMLPVQATAQALSISEDEFGQPRAGTKQSRVSLYARDMDGIEPARDFPSGPIRDVADAVGLLHVMQAGFDERGKRVTAACTATLVSSDIILTNAHCVKQEGADRALKIEWILGYEKEARRASAPRIRVYLDPLEIDDRLDYALLRLAEDVRGIAPVKLNPRDPAANERLFIVGHPLGIEKHVSHGLCRAYSTPLDGIDINHKCNTHEGNSGSPIFSDVDRGSIVGLHKSGGLQVNKGTRMTSLLRESRILAEISGLKRLPEPEIPPVSAGPLAHIRACDAAAAHPDNPDNPPGVPGLPMTRLHATDAIAICRAALEITPRHPRLMFQLGRAYHKAGEYDQAATHYEYGVKRDYAASMNNLARLYIDGEGVRKNVRYGIDLYERAIKLNHGVAATNLGDMYRDANGVTQNYAKALQLYHTGYKLGDVQAAVKIGWMHDKGFGVPRDDVEAVKWYRIGAREDIDWALNNLGHTQIWEDLAVRDYAAGRRNIERAYRLGYVKYAAHNLGRIYEEGRDVRVDYDKAEAFFQESADAGNLYAQIRLGDLWRDRKDGAEDYEKARAYYQAAWDAGEIEGAAKVAWLLDTNKVTNGNRDQDAKDAHRLYELAAAAGIGWAMGNIGSNYLYGDGVEENPVKALEWYDKALEASPDLDWVHSNLGEIYVATAFLPVLPVDGAKARHHFEKGHALGDEESTANLIALLSNLPDTKSLADPNHYSNFETDEAHDYRMYDANRAIAWAQAIGVLTKPVPAKTTLNQRLNIVARLPEPQKFLSDPDTRKHVLAAQAEAKKLLASHIQVMEENADNGWAWGQLGGNTADLLSSLFSQRIGPRPADNDHALRNRLLALSAKVTAKWNPEGPSWGSHKKTVTQMQLRLEGLGFSVGGADGSMGPATRRGIRAFQQAIGLERTGEFDVVTSWAIMRADELDIDFR